MTGTASVVATRLATLRTAAQHPRFRVVPAHRAQQHEYLETFLRLPRMRTMIGADFSPSGEFARRWPRYTDFCSERP